MGYFIDNKLIDCSLICDKTNIDSSLTTKFLNFFSKLEFEEDYDLFSIFVLFDYKLDNDITLSTYFKFFHTLKYAIYTYYKNSEQNNNDDMIIFYYYDSELIPTIKKIYFRPGLYKDSLKEYGDCDLGGLLNNFHKNLGPKCSLVIDTNKLKTIVPIINNYTSPKNQIFFLAITKKTDYLEYLYLFLKLIKEIKPKSMQTGISIKINTSGSIITYELSRKSNSSYFIQLPFAKELRDYSKITDAYYVKNSLDKLYKNLINCNTFKSATSFTFPCIEKEKILPTIIQYTQNFLTELKIHKPKSFHFYLENFNFPSNYIEIKLEIFHLLKNLICKYNDNNSANFIALYYDENKIPYIVKLDHSRTPIFLENEVTAISEFRTKLIDYIQNSETEIRFEINLDDLSNFDNLMNTIIQDDIHFPIPYYLWEYLNVIATIQNEYPNIVEEKKEKTEKSTIFIYSRKEIIVESNVSISLSELEKKLCIWLAYKGKSNINQINNFLHNLSTDKDIFNKVFSTLYQKGLIEIATENGKIFYVCTFDVDKIQDSVIPISIKYSEYNIIKILRSIPTFEQVIKNGKKQLCQINYYYDIKTKYFLPADTVSNKIGIGKINLYSNELFFKFSPTEIYQLDMHDYPNIFKIAKCVQRAIDVDLYKTYKHIFFVSKDSITISNHFISAIPIPMLRILFLLDSKSLEADFSAPEITFHNISKTILQELVRILSNKLFVFGDKND